MTTIKVNRGIYTNTLTETEIDNILTQNAFLKSILLMVLDNSDSWENEHEVEFSRAGAIDYLSSEVFNGYNQEYIARSLSNLISKIN
jgi:hypothetical protein